MGAVVAHVILLSSITTFVVRLIARVEAGHWMGLPILLSVFPLAYLLYRAPELNRPWIYYVQIGLMIVWIVTLFLADYLLKFDFRQTLWMVICFAVLFFAGTGGMIGVAALAGSGWAVSAVILFLVSAALAFVQRAVTGV